MVGHQYVSLKDRCRESFWRIHPVASEASSERRSWWNYAVEGLVVLLFVAGIWLGRRQRFLWLLMSIFLADMVLHLGFGFGINEVYIMATHWIYVIPLAMGYIFKSCLTRAGTVSDILFIYI